MLKYHLKDEIAEVHVSKNQSLPETDSARWKPVQFPAAASIKDLAGKA